LIEFAQGETWMPALQGAADVMAKVTQQQWEAFAKSAT
jgi:hypothetical protein